MSNSKSYKYLTDGEIDLTLIKKMHINHKKKYPVYKYKISLHGSEKKIGVIDIIIGYNETVKYCGNIGCEIFKDFRGNSYAQKACKIIRRVAIAHGMNKLVITCSPTNFASRRICEKMDFTYLETIELPTNKNLCVVDRNQENVCVYEYILYC